MKKFLFLYLILIISFLGYSNPLYSLIKYREVTGYSEIRVANKAAKSKDSNNQFRFLNAFKKSNTKISLFYPFSQNLYLYNPVNDDCTNATTITVNTDATCLITSSGNFENATLSEGFNSTCVIWQESVKDVWYKFTATDTSHVISYTEEEPTYSVSLQLYENTICSNTEEPLYCGESILATDLTIGEEYYIRVFMTQIWGGSESIFEVCVRTLNAPENDDCSNSITLPVNEDETCTESVDSSFADSTVTPGFENACQQFDTAYKDVWFDFVATNSAHEISISNYDDWGLNIQVFDNTDDCELGTPLACINQNNLSIGGLLPNNSYKIRIFTTSQTDNSDFTICLTTIESTANDDCTSSTTILTNPTNECTITAEGTFDGATQNIGFNDACNTWSVPYKDVWYDFTATSTSHNIEISDYNGFSIGLSLYDSTNDCQPSEFIACTEGNLLMTSNLTIGNSYKIKVFTTTSEDTSSFTVCVKTPTPPSNDECEDAISAPVNSTIECSETIDGTLEDATLSNNYESTCSDWITPAKDVWYEFTATSVTHSVILSNYNGYDVGLQAYKSENGCENLTQLVCNEGSTLLLGELEVGATYKIRVFSTSLTNQTNFTLCINTIDAPLNDSCNNPMEIEANDGGECELSFDATLNNSTLTPGIISGCNNGTTFHKDIWFKFTAISTSHAILYSNFSDDFNWSVSTELYLAEDCENLNPAIFCGTGTDNLVINNLTIGEEYLIRVLSANLEVMDNFTICINTSQPPISVNVEDYTVEQLVQDVLVGNSCLVSNITWSTGTNYGTEDNGISYFNKNGSPFTFEEGIVLSTGNYSSIPGPALDTSDGSYDWLGDQQLFEYMTDLGLDVDEYYNASILEFDFIPVKSDFSFEFIFSSSEYGTYQCSFSDAFAFFLTDTETNEITNLALLPDGVTPISVTTIRDCQYYTGDSCSDGTPCSMNEEYFDVFYGQNGLPNLLSPISFKGQTVPLTAQSTVIPGRTYHIKLVIADRNDTSLDSAVFIKGGSFDIGSVDLGEDLLVENNNALCEGEDVILDSQLDTDFYNIDWYKDDVLIPNENGSTLIVTETGTYRIEAKVFDLDCGLSQSVMIEIYPPILLTPINDIEYCGYLNDELSFDLTTNEDILLSQMDNLSDIKVSYHTSSDDAEESTNPIINPQNFSSESISTTIYLRIENIVSGCYKTTSFELIRKVIPNYSTPQEIITCVYHNVIEPVDLTVTETEWRSQSENDIVITYHISEQNAINNTGSITNISNYTPSTLPTTIYVSIVDSNLCQAIRSIRIEESERLSPLELPSVTNCTNFTLPELPENYYYSTEEFGKGEIVSSGRIFGIGSHNLYINIANEDGCVFSSLFEIEVINCTIQKGISPNGDGMNDNFDLTFYKPNKVIIFNRFGKEVYTHGQGYTNQWQGQDKSGNALPEGTYFYRVITDFEEFTGYVYLSRELK